LLIARNGVCVHSSPQLGVRAKCWIQQKNNKGPWLSFAVSSMLKSQNCQTDNDSFTRQDWTR
jgi:hypothetical protein